MKKVLMPLAPGFEEIETVTIIDVLRRAGVNIVTAGTELGALKGSRRIFLMADKSLDEIEDDEFDMVVLPGGKAGVDRLRADSRVIRILKRMWEHQKIIGAICAAPLVLRDAGLIEGVKITSYPDLETELSESDYQQARVVVDGQMITSRGPGTAMEFALKLVAVLVSQEKADQLADLMLTEKVK